MAESSGKAGPGPGEEGVNVQVLLRCRPLSDKEIAERTPQVISVNEATREVTLYQNAAGKQLSRTFRYDKTFGTDCTQEKIFKQAISPIVEEVMDGFNCTIFAYGQTGTGKTYTMEGGPRQSDDGRVLSAEAGVIPRSIKQIFDTLEASDSDSTVKVSFLELYNEELTDLLSFDDAKDDSKRLRLLEDRTGVVVQGLEEMIVKSSVEIYQVLDRGTAKRRTAETWLNKRSSRSHSIFSITIHMREATPDGEDVVKVGKLNLVDLAGSENISRSGAKDSRAREAGSINTSLLTLGRVITALVEHSGHVPYRDSKLTRLLRDSLGGRTKTCIIATIAPTVQCQEETISTLDYAHRAKNIRNRPEVNQKISKTAMLKEVSLENDKLRAELLATREKNGVYLPQERYNEEQMELARLRDQTKALSDQLREERESSGKQADEIARVAQEVSQLKALIVGKDAELAMAYERAKHLAITVQQRQFVIAAHQRAERKLLSQASELRQDFVAAAQDVGALFASVEELSELQDGDRQAMARLQDTIKEHLSSLGNSLGDAAAGQAQQLSEISGALAAFKLQKQQDIVQLQEQVARAQASLGQLTSAVSQQTADVAGAADAALQRSSKVADSYSAQAVTAATALESAARAAISALVSALEEQTEQLRGFALQQAKDAAACRETLSSSMVDVTACFDGLRGAAIAAKAGMERRYGSLEQGLGSFSKEYQDASQLREARLVQQLTELVQGHTQERNAALAQGVRALQQRIHGDLSAASSGMQEMEAAAASGAERTKVLLSAVPAQLEQQEARLNNSTDTLARVLERCSGECLGLQRELVEAAQGATALAQSLQQDAATLAAEASTSLQAAAGACSREAGSAEGAVLECHATISAGLTASLASDQAAADKVAGISTQVSDCLNATLHAQRQATAQLAQGVEADLQQRLGLQPQATAPTRRPLSVPPPDFMDGKRCPPDDVLMQQFRQQHELGHDPSMATAALKSPAAVASKVFFPQSASSTAPPTASPPRAANAFMAQMAAAAANENATPLQQAAGGAMAAAPESTSSPQRSGVRVLRSRIPGKPTTLPQLSPAKGLAEAGTGPRQSSQLLGDRTNQAED